MRKITETIANAFLQGANKTQGNTSVLNGKVYLHGNLIAQKGEAGEVYMTLAGWNTPTTRERLNGIAQVLGLDASFTQRNFEPYFNGKQIAPNQFVEVHA